VEESLARVVPRRTVATAPDLASVLGDGFAKYSSVLPVPRLLAIIGDFIDTHYTRAIEPLGVSVIAWRVLVAVYRNNGKTAGEIAACTLVPRPTLTRALDELERAGLVTRRRDECNRRSVFVEITNTGECATERGMSLVTDHFSGPLRALTVPEQEELREQLLRLLAALASDKDVFCTPAATGPHTRRTARPSRGRG
jgi:DNA-binding MarR family transcriptional regulator